MAASSLEAAVLKHGETVVQVAIQLLTNGTLRIDSNTLGTFIKVSVLRTKAEKTARLDAMDKVVVDAKLSGQKASGQKRLAEMCLSTTTMSSLRSSNPPITNAFSVVALAGVRRRRQ